MNPATAGDGIRAGRGRVSGRRFALVAGLAAGFASACGQDSRPAPAALVPSQPPAAVASPLAGEAGGPCARKPGNAMVRVAGPMTAAPELGLYPDPGLGPAAVSMREDINADGEADLIVVFTESCGNHGECPHAALIACGDDRYAVVWGPEYALHLEPVAEGRELVGSGWLGLQETLRDGAEDVGETGIRIWSFDGERYDGSAE